MLSAKSRHYQIILFFISRKITGRTIIFVIAFMYQRADLDAPATINATGLINLWILKPFLVRLHGNSLFGADAVTSTATAAIFFC